MILTSIENQYSIQKNKNTDKDYRINQRIRADKVNSFRNSGLRVQTHSFKFE